jgi:uncharacterized protein
MEIDRMKEKDMPERTTYPHGVPCWVDTLQADVDAACAFYKGIFGWDFAGPGPMPADGRYYVARLRGFDVAGVGSRPERSPIVPAWTIYVSVDSADEAAKQTERAGGSVVLHPLDAAPAGRAAVLTDPEGAVFGVWEARERKGAQLVNDAGAWSWTNLNTGSPERAKTFYSAVFGWQIETMGSGNGAFTMFRVPGYVGGKPEQPVPRDVVAGISPLDGAGVPPHWSVDFWVDDVDDTARNALALGGRVVLEPYNTEIARQAVLADPQGAVFSVSKVLL